MNDFLWTFIFGAAMMLCYAWFGDVDAAGVTKEKETYCAAVFNRRIPDYKNVYDWECLGSGLLK